MSYDVNCYELAETWLKNKGWNNTIDIPRLAQRIQDCIEDFEADLDNELSRTHETHHL